MTQEVIQKQDVDLEEALVFLGVDEKATSTEILSSFQERWNEIPDPKGRNILINAKNILIQNLVSAQMKQRRFFEIISPFENSCIACHGSGELYRFKKKTVEVRCHTCGGAKTIIKDDEDCPFCQGSGRYVRKFEEGGGINVECRKCFGTGKRHDTCMTCHGKGTIPKVVKSHEIESTTTCKVCGGKGFAENKPAHKHTPDNPALPPEAARTLYSLITSPDDPAVDSADPNFAKETEKPSEEHWN